jgi:hypothetical protein
MNPREWKRLKDPFYKALGASESGRRDLSAGLRASEPELAGYLERMPAEHESPSMDLTMAPFGGESGREKPRFAAGDVAARRFRVLRFIGRGDG